MVLLRRRALLSVALLGVWIAVSGCTTPVKTKIPAREFVGITRVACAGLPDPERSSYPAVLQALLGPAYDVRNFGVSGATMLREGDHPYFATQAYAEALKFKPHVVVIALGTNDSKPQNWRFRGSFERDTYAMVRAFMSLPTRPTVYVCAPPPVFADRWGIRDGVVTHEIAPTIRAICVREGWPIIDLNAALRDRADEFPDGVHPNAMGATSLADIVEATFRGR
jgi:acyl-CoA thioesterase-1